MWNLQEWEGVHGYLSSMFAIRFSRYSIMQNEALSFVGEDEAIQSANWSCRQTSAVDWSLDQLIVDGEDYEWDET